MAEFKLGRRLFLNADKSRVVEEGDPEAAFVLGGRGSIVSNDDVEKYGLTPEEHGEQSSVEAATGEADPQATAPDSEDLESLTVADLKERAKEAGITGYSGMNKADLIAALQDAE